MRYVDRTMDLEAALRDVQHVDQRVRARAAGALGSADEALAARACEALRLLLRDDHADVRYAAALSLGELHDGAAIAALVEQMDGDGHALPRQAAVIALGLIGDPRATPHLVSALRSAAPDVRFQATTSLVQVDPAGAVRPLRAALRDEDPEVRGSAAAALGDLGDRGSADAVAALLEDPATDARCEAALTLARLGDRRGAPLLALLLADRQRQILAAEHLFRCPDADALPAVRRALGRWLAPPLLKVWLSGMLARLGEDEGRVRLLELLASRRQMVRGVCIEVLGAVGSSWAREALRQLATSPAGVDWQEEIAQALADPRRA